MVLSRKTGEEIYISLNGVMVKIKVNQIGTAKVRIAIDAPPEVAIYRKEAYMNLPDRPAVDGEKNAS